MVWEEKDDGSTDEELERLLNGSRLTTQELKKHNALRDKHDFQMMRGEDSDTHYSESNHENAEPMEACFLEVENESDFYSVYEVEQDDDEWDTLGPTITNKEPGARQRFLKAADDIKGAFTAEAKLQEEKEYRSRRDFEARQARGQFKPDSVPRRRPGPWRAIEICTWTCMITIMAGVQSGWQGLEPITTPNFDLTTVRGRNDARVWLTTADPDLLIVAWP